MLGFVFATAFALLSTTAAARPSKAEQAATCELGAAILQEMPPTGTPYVADLPYIADNDVFKPPKSQLSPPDSPDLRARYADWSPSNLFKACPALRTALPPGKHIASAEEIAASGRFPSPQEGSSPPATASVTVYAISAPLFDRRRRDALVAQSYNCPGLCAGYFISRWRKIDGRWREWTPPRLLVVSKADQPRSFARRKPTFG